VAVSYERGNPVRLEEAEPRVRESARERGDQAQTVVAGEGGDVQSETASERGDQAQTVVAGEGGDVQSARVRAAREEAMGAAHSTHIDA